MSKVESEPIKTTEITIEISDDLINKDKVANNKITVEIPDDLLKKDKLPNNNIITQFPKVNDVWRYKIRKSGSCLTKIDFKTRDNKFENLKFVDLNPTKAKNNNIVLLLESPHKKEFTNKFKPIAPAQGKTGEHIDNNIVEVLSYIDCKLELFQRNKTYNLIIANPVQYQASLAYYLNENNKNKGKRKKIKLDIWNKIWEMNGIKDDFKERIEKYKPILIINACTKGDKNKKGIKPQNLISQFLINEFPNTELVETHHPSIQWNNKCYGIKF